MNKKTRADREAQEVAAEAKPKDLGLTYKKFNPDKPHKTIVSKAGGDGETMTIHVQDGIAYEHGSYRPMGPFVNLISQKSDNIIVCPVTGATFPNTRDGRIAYEQFKDRKGISSKSEAGMKVPESTLDERKEVIAERREGLFAQEGKDKHGRYPDGIIPVK